MSWQGGCWGGKGVADADVPGNATPAFPVGSPSIPDGFSGVQPSSGSSRWGRQRSHDSPAPQRCYI